MRGIATVIAVALVSIVTFGILGPALLEPIVEVVTSNAAVQSSSIDAAGIGDSLLTVVLVYAPLLVMGSGVVFAAVWYLRRERVGRRV